MPSDDRPLWRYVDLAKLISMLHKSSLYCCQLGLLADHREGKFPAKWADAYRERCRAGEYWHLDPDDPSTVEHIRSCVYVNSWCMQDYESEALWKRYGGPAGIAIRSSLHRLGASLGDDCMLGCVKYVDWREGLPDVPDAMTYDLPFLKGREFDAEREVRVVCWAPMLTSHGLPEPEWNEPRMNMPPGLYYRVNVATLIDGIVVNAEADKWFVEAVKAAALRFGLRAPVTQSSLRHE